MKFSEVIAELEMGSDDYFISDVKVNGDNVTPIVVKRDNYLLDFKYTNGLEVVSISLNRLWRKARIPVPWHEAIQAYAEHGNVFSIRMNGVEVFRQAEGCKLGINGDETSTVYLEPYIDPSYILKGEWYIED